MVAKDVKNLGKDDKGRKLTLTDEGNIRITTGGASATLTRKSLVNSIERSRLEMEKWQFYLDLLDNEQPAPATAQSEER